jgi:copper(I)-binding protein
VSSTTVPSRPVRLALVTAAVLGLSACGASLDAQTYQERNNAESTDTAVGTLALRDLAVEPPSGERYDVGDDAGVSITVTNAAPEQDRLAEVTSPDAEEVAVVDEDGEETEMQVPSLGSTQGLVQLELRGLTRELRSGEYVTLQLRFEQNGATEVLVPVILSGRATGRSTPASASRRRGAGPAGSGRRRERGRGPGLHDRGGVPGGRRPGRVAGAQVRCPARRPGAVGGRG